MSTDRVLAIDPGKVTGLALYFPGEPVQASQAEDWWQTARSINTLCPNVDVVVIESFVVRANTHKLDAGSFAHTTDMIGAVRYMAALHDCDFVKQTPGQAKSFADDAKLKKLGWYNPTEGGHANDASRHLLTYLASQRVPEILEGLTA